MTNRSLLLAFLLLSLGSSAFAGPTAPPQQPASSFQLAGLWHGQFPAHEGNEGVDIEFSQNAAHFMLDGKRVARQDLQMERKGDTLTLWLTSRTNPDDRAEFTGTFVDANTVRGRYVNKLRAEDFAMDLVKQQPSTNP